MDTLDCKDDVWSSAPQQFDYVRLVTEEQGPAFRGLPAAPNKKKRTFGPARRTAPEYGLSWIPYGRASKASASLPLQASAFDARWHLKTWDFIVDFLSRELVITLPSEFTDFVDANATKGIREKIHAHIEQKKQTNLGDEGNGDLFKIRQMVISRLQQPD
ncbi:hypothetical protein EJ06DRAFT_545523 [Trichodelitschia bisporula]|uniref:Uncharacterized protein n=1 Tax=Trichodelitschia bisporula TaxID=703511 RepID=A0A6G1IA04_9PEZI|nr:hypothetical protein EJ06DRAFT_545523 [Trichodelitschia bisporula]